MQTTAAVLHEPTDSTDFTADLPLEFERVEVPDPVGEEVLVEIQAASLCHTDVSIAHGHIDETYPLVMGHEGAGIVRAVGDEVEHVSEGDHVVLGRTACRACQYCRQGKPQLCTVRNETTPQGVLRHGAARFRSNDGDVRYHCHGVSSFTEHTLVTEEVAIPITKDVPFEKATLLGCGVFTGFGAVENTADVELGSTVAVFGAGGVGMSAIQAARLARAKEIIAVDLVDDKLETAERLGATLTINGAEEDPVERIREYTGGVDYAFDLVGNPAVVEQAVDVLKPTGTSVLVGTPSAGKHAVDIELHDLILSEKAIQGSFNGSYDLGVAIPKLADLVADGDLDLEPLITATRPMSELPQAMEDLEGGNEIRQVLLP